MKFKKNHPPICRRSLFSLLTPKVGILILFFSLLANSSLSSNLQVINVQIVPGPVGGDYAFVQFDLSWEHAFFVENTDYNITLRDAAWVFVKYRIGNGEWQHAKLNETGNVAVQGDPTILPGLINEHEPFHPENNPAVGVIILHSNQTAVTVGEATQKWFPATNLYSVGLRGGAWNFNENSMRISDRSFATFELDTFLDYAGARFVRSLRPVVISSSVSSVSVSPEELPAGQAVTITASIRDQFGKAIGNLGEQLFEVSFDQPNTSIIQGSFGEVETGVYQTQFTSADSQTVILTLTVDQTTFSDQPHVTFTGDRE